MDKKDTKEAYKKIEDECNLARAALQRAATIAKEAGVSFCPAMPGDYYIAAVPAEIRERWDELESKETLTKKEQKEYEKLEKDFDYGGIYYRPYQAADYGLEDDYSGWWSPSNC